MFKLIVVCALVAVVAAVGSDDVHAEITSLKSDVRPDGFDTLLETSNTIQQSASGDEHGNIHGVFSWVSPEGQHVEVKYVADENGYQPQSDLLPTPPPIPVEILKAIDWIKAHPSKESDGHH